MFRGPADGVFSMKVLVLGYRAR